MPDYTLSDIRAMTQPKSTWDNIKQGVGNLGAGAVRGAGSIGATLLSPIDVVSDALDGKGLSLESNRARRAAMDDALRELGANPDSALYQVGKIGGEIAGTAGAGGLLANGARALGASAPVVEALASGGFSGGGNMLTRSLAGAANGALTGGMIDPSNAGSGALIGGALPGVAKLAGMGGNMISELSDLASKKLMQSALKPTIAQLRTGQAQDTVDTLLKYGLNPTKGGVDKMRGMIDDLNQQISDKIANSGATIDKSNVVGTLNDVTKKFSNQVSPTGDLSAIQKVADDFLAHPTYPGATIPVQGAQDLKQGTYSVLNGKYGQLGSAETEAQKGLARGLKEQIAAAVPDVGALNGQESELINALNVTERRALMDMNKNPAGLSILAHNPMAAVAFMADKSALFKSLAARSINAAGGAASGTGGLLGTMLENPVARTGLLSVGNGP